MGLPAGKGLCQPKRSTNAFMHFCKARRDGVRLAHPGIKLCAMTTILSQMWREADQTPYQKLAAEASIRYKSELAAFVAAGGERKKYSRKSDHKSSAYILYSTETHIHVQRENPKASSRNIIKIIAQNWRAASPEVKQHYEEEYRMHLESTRAAV
jgi:hypothetical protein